MKKIYNKPEFRIDSFSLNSGVAGSCSITIPSNEDSCTFYLGFGETLFQNAYCTDWDWDRNNKICYDVPVNSFGGTVFSS